MSLTTRGRRLVAGLAALVGVGAAAGIVVASDHQDTAQVELNPKMDLTDFYAFPGANAGRIVLAMNTRAFLPPSETRNADFDPSQLYQFKVDNTGDAREDRVIQVTFTGTGANQRVEVRGPLVPPVQGSMMNRVADVEPVLSGPINEVLGSATGMQVFAGPRDDSFYIDLERAFCILPDRKPVQGPLSQPCPAGTAQFRSPGVNYTRGFNVMSIVIELPKAMLENTAPGRLGLWATISR